MDDDHLDVIAARKALADPERISLEDSRKELGLNEAPKFHYQIICEGHFRATVPNGIALDRMVREALSRGRPVKIELREGPAPRHNPNPKKPDEPLFSKPPR